MKIELLAFDSMGVRSMATFVKTKDFALTIDPGVALGPKRYGLEPHPLEYKEEIKRWMLVQKKAQEILDLPCFHTESLLIRYDGNVSLCCWDDYCRFSLGNAFETPIKEIWWSKKHVSTVRNLQLYKSKKNYPLCSVCYMDQDRLNWFEKEEKKAA